MKLIGKSSCIVTLRGFSGNNTLAVSNTMLSSVYVTPSPGLVTLDFLIISCSSWSWPCKCQPRVPASHPAGGLVHFYLKWVETLTVMELVLYLSLRVARICTGQRREKRGRILTQDRGTPHLEANAPSFMMEGLLRNPHNMTLHITDCIAMGTERHQHIEKKLITSFIVSFVLFSGYH